MENGVSVIVCCYNSENRIIKTLKHLFSQEVSEDLEWEIILVNNNSSDNTTKVAQAEWEKQNRPVSFRIVDEPIPGLSHARERGIHESVFGYLLFCDDDNHLDSDYIKKGHDILQTNNNIAMLGGIGFPLLEKEKPEWFAKSYRIYAVGPQEEGNYDLTYTKYYTYGAGSFIRKQAYARIKEKGVKFLLTDRKGKKLVSGGDNEIGYLFVAAGYKVYWDERLKFKHLIPSNRLNLDYIKRMRYGYASTYEIVMSYQSWLKNGKNDRTGNLIFREFISSFRITVRLFLKNPTKHNDDFNFVLKYYFHLGRVMDIVTNFFKYPGIHRRVEQNLVMLGFNPK